MNEKRKVVLEKVDKSLKLVNEFVKYNQSIGEIFEGMMSYILLNMEDKRRKKKLIDTNELVVALENNQIVYRMRVWSKRMPRELCEVISVLSGARKTRERFFSELEEWYLSKMKDKDKLKQDIEKLKLAFWLRDMFSPIIRRLQYGEEAQLKNLHVCVELPFDEAIKFLGINNSNLPLSVNFKCSNYGFDYFIISIYPEKDTFASPILRLNLIDEGKYIIDPNIRINVNKFDYILDVGSILDKVTEKRKTIFENVMIINQIINMATILQEANRTEDYNLYKDKYHKYKDTSSYVYRIDSYYPSRWEDKFLDMFNEIYDEFVILHKKFSEVFEGLEEYKIYRTLISSLCS